MSAHLRHHRHAREEVPLAAPENHPAHLVDGTMRFVRASRLESEIPLHETIHRGEQTGRGGLFRT